MPDGVQLRRVRGWRLPPNARSVARPTRWGNPFVVGKAGDLSYHGETPGEPGRYGGRLVGHDRSTPFGLTAEQAVWLYRDDLTWMLEEPGYDELRDALEGLRGFDLACWCPLGEPCHRDVLLEVANR